MCDSDDDAMTMAALAASATTVTQLQMMAQCLGNILSTTTTIIAGKSGPTSSEEEGEFLLEFEDDHDESAEADPRPTKRTRVSYPRPGYSASVWGVMLETMGALHGAHQLHPACSQAEEFRRQFRVPYEFFLLLVEVVKPWFGTATRDVAQRDCVPVTLKVWCAVYMRYVRVQRDVLAGNNVQTPERAEQTSLRTKMLKKNT